MEELALKVLENSVVAGAFLYLLHAFISKFSVSQAKIADTLDRIADTLQNLEERVERLETKEDK